MGIFDTDNNWDEIELQIKRINQLPPSERQRELQKMESNALETLNQHCNTMFETYEGYKKTRLREKYVFIRSIDEEIIRQTRVAQTRLHVFPAMS